MYYSLHILDLLDPLGLLDPLDLLDQLHSMGTIMLLLTCYMFMLFQHLCLRAATMGKQTSGPAGPVVPIGSVGL